MQSEGKYANIELSTDTKYYWRVKAVTEVYENSGAQEYSLGLNPGYEELVKVMGTVLKKGDLSLPGKRGCFCGSHRPD